MKREVIDFGAKRIACVTRGAVVSWRAIRRAPTERTWRNLERKAKLKAVAEAQ